MVNIKEIIKKVYICSICEKKSLNKEDIIYCEKKHKKIAKIKENHFYMKKDTHFNEYFYVSIKNVKNFNQDHIYVLLLIPRLPKIVYVSGLNYTYAELTKIKEITKEEFEKIFDNTMDEFKKSWLKVIKND